jgi:hypothetical protein
MFKIAYNVSLEESQAELEWLKGQKIYPSYGDTYDWSHGGERVIEFCMIVTEDAVTAIKLRHPLKIQEQYRGK